MAGYTKLFSDMLDSTVWQLSKEARLLFITMLLKKDRNQMVKAPIPGLAHAARLTLEETESAMEELTAPDKYSQSTEHEGRRILRIEGGWFVVNGEKYRDKMSADERREYKRIWQRDNRQKKAEANQAIDPMTMRPYEDRPGEEGMTLNQKMRRRVAEDPVTKSDQAASAKWGKGKPARTKVAEEYDLDDGDTNDLIQPKPSNAGPMGDPSGPSSASPEPGHQ